MEVKCSESICCRNSSGPINESNPKSGKFGYLGKCDIPLETVDSFIRYATNETKPDFVLYLGDTPAHNMWEQTPKTHFHGLREFSKKLEEFNVPVFPILGNHEGYPCDQFDTENKETHKWILEEAMGAWSKWFDAKMNETFFKNSCYSKVVDGTKLKLIAITAFTMMSDNTYMYGNQTDPLEVVCNL